MLACSRCYEETDRETDIARRDPSQLVRSGARERCIVAEPGEASMGSQLYSLGLTGSLLLAISACEAAPEESSVARADKHEICLADPPVDVPTRQVFELNDHLIAFYDGRNTLRLSPDPNWVDDAANKLGVATYAIHQGHDAIVFDTFPTIDQAQWQRSTLEAMGITHFTIVTSHWHNDHIAGNVVYQDSEIVMTARGLQFMNDLQADLEAGTT